MAKKPRIYDLAKALTINESDEKIRKQKQSDFQKDIVSICKSLGEDKSSSSALDDEIFENVVVALNTKGHSLDLKNFSILVQEVMLNKRIEKNDIPVVEDKPKKELRIVRRIKPNQIQEEKIEAEEKIEENVGKEIAPPPLPVQRVPLPPINPQPKVQSHPVVFDKRFPRKDKPRFESVIPVEIPDESTRVRKKDDWSKDKVRGKDEKSPQPFRVARPSLTPSMMGRTKRPTKRKDESTTKGKEKIVELEEEKKPSTVLIDKQMTVKELAERMQLPETEVVKSLFSLGVIRTVNQIVEVENAIKCATKLEYEIITKREESTQSLRYDISNELDEDLRPRPPIVTIMGHVDHGKTTLLDAIREAKFNVTDSEKGGITQHIGAYQIEITDYDGNHRKITFLDTPGHEAFTLIRARGAQLTDIAILVVAADDGVMPQTIEAIDHAKAAGVPIIIAMNKIDKEGIQPDKVLGELADHDLLVEDYGGKVVCSKISAKKRINLDDLLTKITLVADAELSEKLRSNPNRPATGVVIEAERSKERGPIVDMLIQSGTLRKGDCLVAGTVAGRVRAMFNDHGQEIEEATPSMPVEIIGLSDVPHAGDIFEVKGTYQEAKKAAEEKHAKEKEQRKSLGLAEFASKVREGTAHELKIIIKADMHGSAEAVSKEVAKLSTKDVVINPIHIGSGNITETDVTLAASANAIVIGFHVSPDSNAQKAISELGVDIRLYDIIYKITEDLERAVLGLLEPEKEEVKLGQIEVRQIFTYGKNSKIAGCYVTEGKILRNEIAKVYRNGQVIHQGKINNLKRFKDDVKEVQTNFECGISFDSFNDLQEKDIIECWTIVEKARTSLS